MRILIDAKTLQGRAHLLGGESDPGSIEPGERLSAFVELLTGLDGGSTVEFTRDTPGLTFNPDKLALFDVLVIPTRVETYDDAELDAIYFWVTGGGGLLLMSNHAPYHELNVRLGQLAGVNLEGRFCHTPGAATTIEGEYLNDNHPIIKDPEGRASVSSIVVNTTDALSSERGTPIAFLPPGMRDRIDPNIEPGGKFFGVAFDLRRNRPDETALLRHIETDPDARGRLVVLADSGLIGTKGTLYPGVGLLHEGDNETFIRRTILWLAMKL